MALPGTGTKINGHVYDWSSVSFDFAGRIYGGILEISYSDKLDVGELRGVGSIRRGTTRGQYSAEGSVTVAKEDWEAIKLGVAQLGFGGGGFGEQRFLITVSYREAPSIIAITDTVEQCRIVGVENSHSTGNDALSVKLTLDVHRVGHNGLYLVNDESQAANLLGL